MASGIPPKKKAEIAPETDAQPTYRMSMLPLGTYANPDGTESLGMAVPGMIYEPFEALKRLAANSVDENGNIAIPNPENPQNQQDVLTGVLSLYGGNALNPARMAEGAAARAVPEALPAARMYHGTGVPEDFATFTPSPKGSLGPGVYLSKEADTTLPWANNGPNPRIMPVDVSGRIATYDDYLAARQASPDQAATIQALMDQGYTGAAMDVPGKSGNMNVTNVFKPGSIRSATTGETLFSDTGLPSLPGSLATRQDTSNSNTNGDGSMFLPPQVGMLSGVPGTTLSNPAPNAPQMALPAGLLTGMDMSGAAPQTPPAATPAAAPANPIMAGLVQGDKDAIAAMPQMADFQFQAPQRASVDLSRLAAIAQARGLGSRA